MLLLSFAGFIIHRQLSLIFLYRALFFLLFNCSAWKGPELSRTQSYNRLQYAGSLENLTEMLRSIQATF